MYDVYSPSSKNCGRECLKHYKVEADKGMLSIAMMKSLSPVPVLKFEKGEKRDEFNKLSKSLPEFILLRENHFVRCILKTENKKQKLLKRMEITEEKVENHIKKLELKQIKIPQSGGLNLLCNKIQKDIKENNLEINEINLQISYLKKNKRIL
jgi:ABC-type transporter Mla MlaB component